MNALQVAPLTRGIVPPPPRVPSEEDVGAFTIGGEVFLADLGDFDLDGRSPAVVIRWDGTMGVEYPRKADGVIKCGGVRAGWFNVVPDDPRTKEQKAACLIVGRVISRE